MSLQQPPISFQIERGLFKFDFTDHHAVLGVSVDADANIVRKRYLKIARRLHPDSCKAASEADKKLASQLLSKLVNPAYEQLSHSNNRDYLVSLGHLGRRLAAEGMKTPVASDTAKQLFRAGANLDIVYQGLVKKLATNQYDTLSQVLDNIAEISELNMAYLMLRKGEALKPTGRTELQKKEVRKPTESPKKGTSTPPPPGPSAPLPDSGVSRAAEYIRRAEGYMTKNNFAAAVLELREALKLDPNNSRCHSLLGAAYLKQNQATMAKVHVNKALQLNPKDELALKAQRHLEALAQKSGGNTAKAAAQPASNKQPNNKQGGGGLFGGLFGGKKK
jgi:curved DNA-binding protein CbpA